MAHPVLIGDLKDLRRKEKPQINLEQHPLRKIH